MPKRVLDFDAMWGSDKLASCAAWAQAEYAWLYGLADASGCFELTNLRVIWGRVAAIRGSLTLERLEQVFAEFQDKGLLFVWEHEGKRYGHWTGSDVPGRLPPPSWRMRLERFAPPVPKQQFAQYMGQFARGRAALAGVGFRGAEPLDFTQRQEGFKFEISDLREERGRTSGERQGQPMGEQSGLKDRLEEDQAQDLDLNRNLVGNGLGRNEVANGTSGAGDLDMNSNLRKSLSQTQSTPLHHALNSNPIPQPAPRFYSERTSARELAVQRELRVGQGPLCGPGRVKAEVLERDRLRQAVQRARAAGKSP
jgi:hypothetical protein